MSPKTKILITGATGYIGGSVLDRLLSHPDASNFEITAIVRSQQKAEKFKEFCVNAVVGSFSDANLLENLTAAADIVIDMVDADKIEGAKIMLRGCKRRFKETGRPPIFIHTSGVGLFVDDAAGLHGTDIIWDDANPNQMEKLPPTAPHRDVDLEYIKADEEGYVKVYIVAPSTIYGLPSGKLVDAGLMHKHSIQIPSLITASIGRGQAGMVGEGKNFWPNVHIDDLANLYLVLFNAIRGPDSDITGHGREGFYFGVGGEHKMYDVGKALGVALVELGISKSAEPTTFAQDEINHYFKGSNYLGTNCRAQPNRSKSIGWKPTKTTEDLLASIKPEAEEMIKTGYKVDLR